MSELYRCRICDTDHELPADAIEIGKLRKRFGWKIVSFGGKVHDVQSIEALEKRSRSRHVRFHEKRNRKKLGCIFCFPITAQVVKPEGQTPQPETTQGAGQDELGKVVLDTLKELPEPGEVNQESEPDQPKVMGIGRSAMEAAFERLRSNRDANKE